MSITLSILNNEEDVSGFNDTNITLFPKIKSPALAMDSRHIGLCNTMYKLISKTIVNRLKPFMPFVIHYSQSALFKKDS